MNIFIPRYDGTKRLCVVSKTEETTRILLEKKVSTFFVEDGAIVFLPENIRFAVQNNKLLLLKEYDIVEINTLGILYRAFANEEPDATLFMGGGCNSNCIMCPASDQERKHAYAYPRETLIKYIDYLPQDLEYLVITGGEPTLNPKLFLEALEHVQQKFSETNVLLLTNGRSFSNRPFLKIPSKEYPPIFRWQFHFTGLMPTCMTLSRKQRAVLTKL